MTFYLHLIGLLVSVVLSVVFPILICFQRKRVFAIWAKIASILACVSGLGWSFFSFKLHYAVISDLNYDFDRAYAVKGLLGGICIGIVFSILIAKPYVKRVV